MGQFLSLPEVLETWVEDETHSDLVGPKKVLRFVCNLVTVHREMVLSVLRYYDHFAVLRDYRQLRDNCSTFLGPTKPKWVSSATPVSKTSGRPRNCPIQWYQGFNAFWKIVLQNDQPFLQYHGNPKSASSFPSKRDARHVFLRAATHE